MGFVEPSLELYERLIASLDLLERGLVTLELPNTQSARSERFRKVVSHALAIGRKELTGVSLSADDTAWINTFSEQMAALESGDASNVLLVADVFTEPNTGAVLEEGLGPLSSVLVAFPDAQGRLTGALGPVFSNYEFKSSQRARLDAHAWRDKILNQDTRPRAPAWLNPWIQ